MYSFGKKIREIREIRESKKLSQNQLARLIEVHHSIIGKYERDEVKPSIDVVKKIAKTLETTVGYLLGETEDKNILRDPLMLKRLNAISDLPERDKDCILYALDGLIRDAKARLTYGG